MKPARILEIGTFTAYSTICLASGLKKGGILHTIENNIELENYIIQNIKKAGFEDKIQLHLGSATDIISQINEYFDIVFIDADKENYSNYYDLVFKKVKTGGLIIADNALWSRKVISRNENDKETLSLQQFNQKVQADPRVVNVLLPIRDGVMLIRKL